MNHWLHIWSWKLAETRAGVMGEFKGWRSSRTLALWIKLQQSSREMCGARRRRWADYAKKYEHPKLSYLFIFFLLPLLDCSPSGRFKREKRRDFHSARFQSKAPESASSAHLTLTPTLVARSRCFLSYFPPVFFSYSIKLLCLFDAK